MVLEEILSNNSLVEGFKVQWDNVDARTIFVALTERSRGQECPVMSISRQTEIWNSSMRRRPLSPT